MLMQGALGLVAEYDMYGAKLGSSEIVVSPVCLAYSKDGSLLIAVLKVIPFLPVAAAAAVSGAVQTSDRLVYGNRLRRTAAYRVGIPRLGAARFFSPASLGGATGHCNMLT